jgi:hypothetical protein
MTRLVRIEATYFVAGVEIDKHWLVVDAAPILRWAIGKHLSEIRDFLDSKKAFIDWRFVKGWTTP